VFLWLNHSNPPFLMNDDSIRDQLLVRDCTELGRCHLIGAPTSVPGVHQGAVWLDLLIAVRLLGGDTATERTVVLALLAASVATLFIVVWHWLRPSLALPAGALLAGALSLDTYPSLLINPSPSAFADVLCAAALLCFGLSGRLRFLLASTFALAIAINVHVGSVSLVFPLLAVAGLASSRPWRAIPAALAVFAATYVITSSAALRANVIGLMDHSRLVPALAAGLIVTLLAVPLGARFRRLSWQARAWTIGILSVLPFALGLLWLLWWEQHPFGITYLHPIVGPAATLIAALLVLPFELGGRSYGAIRWIPTAGSIAAAALVALGVWEPKLASRAPAWSAWSVADARSIAEHAARRGWTFEDLVFRLQGGDCRELLAGISMMAPPPGSPPKPGRRQLQVVRVPPGAPAPDAGDVIPLGGTAVAVMREVESWLQPEGTRACRVPLGSAGPAQCSSASDRAAEAFSPERFSFISRSFPEIQRLDLPQPYVARYEIPLAPTLGERRIFRVEDRDRSACGWRITRADGVQVEGELPSARVVLHADAEAGSGLLVIEKPFGTSACQPSEIDRRYPPCVFETAPGDPLDGVREAG
jgi:hypothetical protein